MSKEIRNYINLLKKQIINESKNYRVYNPPVGTPSEIKISGKPLLWGMFGPLPDNVIKYINKNLKPVIDYRNGQIALHPTTKQSYVKPIVGKNKDFYFFDETTGNWWTAHNRFQGKAIILSQDEWNSIFTLNNNY